MENNKKRYMLYYVLSILFVCLITVAAGVLIYKKYTVVQKDNANNLLKYYSETMVMKIQSYFNYTNELQYTISDSFKHLQPFQDSAEMLLKNDEILYISLFEGSIVRLALPSAFNSIEIGKELREFPYVYSLAKVLREPVVEGPTLIQGTDKEVFIFIQPIIREDSYLGEIVVVLDKDYVLEQIQLDQLYESGYEYELWRIEPQSGGKEMIARSNALDFSQAAKTDCYFPTQWNISIMPIDGWVTDKDSVLILLCCIAMASVLLGLMFSIIVIIRKRDKLKKINIMDFQSGLYSKEGFCYELNHWIKYSHGCKFTLFYFVMEDYNRLSQMVGKEGEKKFLHNCFSAVSEYVKSRHMIGRVGESNFVIAVDEDMEELQKSDLAKGLSLKLIWKLQLENKKVFSRIGYEYVTCSSDDQSAEQLLQEVVASYFVS